jgi:hypothetical protein
MSMTGFPAWSAWLGLHLDYVRGISNKFTTVADWSWDRFEGPKDTEVTSLTQEEAQAAVEA